jgi:hypothetical protein
MAEQEKATKAAGRSTRQSKQAATKTTTKRNVQSGTIQRRKSVSFQIRTAPETKELAERVASDHNIGGRSKLDADIYKRGLLLTLLLLGPGPDGSYSGQSEKELARQLEPLFDRQYAILDRHQLLSSYVYRVLPPGGAGGVTFIPAGNAMPPANAQNGRRGPGEPTNDEQARYQLSEDAQASLENFAEEI